jgi:hypothetical protein
MIYKALQEITTAMNKCDLKRSRKRRVQVNLTIDPTLLRRIRELMVKHEEPSLSSFTEGLYDCVLRDDCEGCPAYEELPEEEKVIITGKVGVGKQLTE